jgi:hypothetical protein
MSHAPGAPAGDAETATLLLETGQQLRVLRVGALQHLLAAVGLVVAGWETLHDPQSTHRGFGWFALASGLVLVGAVIWELREKHHPIHARLGWVDLVAVPSVLVEVWHRYLESPTHRISYAYVTLALVTVLRGFYLPKLLRLRRLEVGPEGLFYRLRLWHWVRLAWDGVERVEPAAAGLDFHLRNGKTVSFPLHDVRNRKAAEELVLGRWERVEAGRKAREMQEAEGGVSTPMEPLESGAGSAASPASD